jgi:hypothetical protein
MINPTSYVELVTDSEALQAQFQQSFSGRDVVKINDLEFVCTSHNGDKKFGLQEFRRITLAKPKAAIGEWDGEGLPPVGTVCEFKRIGSADWHRELNDGMSVSVIAHFQATAGGELAAFTFEGVNGRQVEQAVADCFYPIHTPEQVEAQARTEAISEMVSALGMDNPGTAEYIRCGMIYDAGFRKEVKP